MRARIAFGWILVGYWVCLALGEVLDRRPITAAIALVVGLVVTAMNLELESRA